MKLKDIFGGFRKKKKAADEAAPKTLRSLEDPSEGGSGDAAGEQGWGEQGWGGPPPDWDDDLAELPEEFLPEEPGDQSDWPGAEPQAIPEDGEEESFVAFKPKELSSDDKGGWDVAGAPADDMPEEGGSGGGWGAAPAAEGIPDEEGGGGWGAPTAPLEEIPEDGGGGDWETPKDASPEGPKDGEETEEEGKKGKKGKKKKGKKEKKPKKEKKSKKKKKGKDGEEGEEAETGKKGPPKLLLIAIPAVVVIAAAVVLLILKPWASKDPPPEEEPEAVEPVEEPEEPPEEPEEPPEEPVKQPASEPLNTAEALDYFGSLSPTALGLEGEDMNRYRWYTTGKSVTIDGMYCMEIMVYEMNESAGTNDYVGKFYLSKGASRKLYRMDDEGSVEELSLSTIGLSG